MNLQQRLAKLEAQTLEGQPAVVWMNHGETQEEAKRPSQLSSTTQIIYVKWSALKGRYSGMEKENSVWSQEGFLNEVTCLGPYSLKEFLSHLNEKLADVNSHMDRLSTKDISLAR